MQNLSCCIIGLGRFGTFWCEFLCQNSDTLCKMAGSLVHNPKNNTTLSAITAQSAQTLQLLVYDTNIDFQEQQHILERIRNSFAKDAMNIELGIANKNMLATADIVFLCVPISILEEKVDELLSLCNEHAVIFDTCSVKEGPVQWIEQARKSGQYFMASHPLFGPDSFKDIKSRKIVIHATHMSQQMFTAWQNVFAQMGLECLSLSPQEHDRQVAYTQGLTHLVGRILRQLSPPLEHLIVRTKGFTTLLDIIEQTCNDSTELFVDMQRHNQYSKELWNDFSLASKKVFDTLGKEE